MKPPKKEFPKKKPGMKKKEMMRRQDKGKVKNMKGSYVKEDC